MSLPPGVKIDVRRVRYPVVRDALNRLPVTQTEGDPTSQIVWWDGLMPSEEFWQIHPPQRVNKIPGMDLLCYKNTFFQALTRMRTLFPAFYDFFPTTFQLPFQFGDFQREHLRLSSKSSPVTWIVKPRAGSCGNGIRLIQNSFDVATQTQLAVVQRYVSPYVLSGYKFDFRFYILIATLRPFTVYIYREGLARFCTHVYAAPTRETLEDRFCHLTNTAVNVANTANHRLILEPATSVLERIASDDRRAAQLWSRIKQVSVLSVVALFDGIVRNVGLVVREPMKSGIDEMHRYFHIVGIDIMINERCEPVVLELNDRPSMSVTYDIEHKLKTELVFDALNVVTVDGAPTQGKELPGGWELAFPTVDGSLFGGTVESMLERVCQGSSLTAKRIIAKRLGYVPSTYQVRAPYRKPLGLPPLHQ
jgi:hypothetical protein